MSTDQLNWQKDNFENIETAWEGDLWERRRLGEQLTSYVDRLQCGAVLALDARCGEGKTWFVRNWKRHLETTEIPHNVIYLDAFANDYLDDPFLVIASEIAAKLDQAVENKLLVHKFKKVAVAIQQGLLTFTPTLIASIISCALTGGLIPLIKIDSEKFSDKLDEAIDKVTDNIGEKVTEAIQNKIDSYEQEKQSLRAFKSTLSELAVSLDKPLVFILDELDRCRPDFAIRLIERIKHFFDIKNIVFVLVMNKRQFIAGIGNLYGYKEEDALLYLDKFIDFDIPLLANKSLLENKKSSYKVVAETFISIGENSADIHFLFHQAMINDMNQRELKRKINIYALLKTNKLEQNMFLAVAIACCKRNILHVLKEIYVRVLKLEMGDGNVSNIPEQSYDIEKFNLIVSHYYEIKLGAVLEYYTIIRQLFISKTKYHTGDFIEKMSEFLNEYALVRINNIDEHILSNQYLNYLRANFDCD